MCPAPAGWRGSPSLYLSHKIAYHLVQVGLGGRLHGATIFVVYAAAALALGSVLHLAVERPFLRLRERRVVPVVQQPATG